MGANGTSGTVYFDAFESRAGGRIGLDANGPSVTPPPARPDALFADNFETGDLSKWNGQLTAVDGGDLSVTASAAQAGAFGLGALIDDTVVLKAVDSTPADETHYRARFYFHPNSLTMSANTSHYIFDGYDSYHGSNPFRLELFYESGAYKLRSRAMKDDWSYNSSSKYTLSNAWHYVEIEWQASSAAGANNGFLSLWIDGTLVETLSALDNDDTAGWLDEVRLGATNGLDSTTSGTLLFDNFESRRNTYIGPVSAGPTHTPTPTATASVTPTPSKTSTPSQTPSATSTPTKTFTPSVTSTPSLTPSATSTPTKTFTPSATPTHTPTASNTPSPTPTSQGGGGPISINASFQYDGDGRRVSQNINGVITYFVGNYYEQTGSTVTKYYYAGASRVAMRSNGTLYFLLGDHLGSTSLTTDASGVVISEMRYTPWGEVRYNAGVTPTDYSYTGQYDNTADFGLMFYQSRWYDPSLGRMAQADTIIPPGVQGLDRYAYANNSPLNFVDPSGHQACFEDGYCPSKEYSQENHISYLSRKYKIQFNDGWTLDYKWAVIFGVQAVGDAFGKQLGKESALAFRDVFGLDGSNTFYFEWDTNCWGCREDPTGCDAGTTKGDACVSAFGYTNTENWIEFASMSAVETPLRNINNVIHELGHAFNTQLGKAPENVLATNYAALLRNEVGFYGDPSNRTWEASSGTNGSETFADQFLGWVYGRWDNADAFGPQRADFMNQMNGAGGWVAQAAGLP